MLPLLSEFKEKLIRDGLSPVTVENMVKALHYFARYLEHENVQKISPKDVERYKIYLMMECITKKGKKLASGTIHHRLAALPPYFKFLVHKKKIFFDPTLNLIIPKDERRLPDYIPSEKDIEELLVMPDTNVFMGIRDRAIFEFLYTCPLRNKELRGLELGDIDMKDKYVYPKRAKGGDECGIPIAKSTYEILMKYLEIARPRLAKRSKVRSDALFLTERGEPFSCCGLGELFVKYRKNKPIHPHSMRHACAVHMLKHGARIREIQVMLGHKNLTSTQVYTRLTANDIKDIQDKYQPREKRYRRAAANRRV